ncbi:MAG: hypothetical protein RL653_2941 [Pseudomonadota bacterium]
MWACLLLAGCHEEQGLQRVRASGFLDTTLVDFGEVPMGEWREQQVRLENTGYVPFRVEELQLLEQHPSFVLEFAPGTLRPGEVRAVTLRFHPVQEGEQQSRARLTTDADDKPLDELTARGTGGPPRVEFRPGALDFETLEVDSDRTLSAEVVNHSDLPLAVRLPDAGPFGAGAPVVPPLSSFPLDVLYGPSRVGVDVGTVGFTACETCTAVPLPVKGRAVPHAFAFDPSPVPFPEVPVHQSTRSGTTLTNITWRPVTVDRLAPSDPAFTPLSPLSGVTLAPGESRPLELEFAARTAGNALAQVDIHYLSDRPRVAPLPLDARGGRPSLALSPVTLDFGEVPVGGQAAAVVLLTNTGTTGPLRFLGLRAAGPDLETFSASRPFRGEAPNPPELPWAAGAAWPTLPLLQPEPIAPGADVLRVRVAFAPLRAGTFNATLTFQSDDLFFPGRTLTLTGQGRTSGPCSYLLRPGALDFGVVPLGTGAVLGFHFANTAVPECAVKDIRVTDDGGGAFFLPGGQVPGGTVPQDSAFSTQVAFRPRTGGVATGEVTFTVNSPTAPTVRLPLRGRSDASCLAAVPPWLDFGPVRTDCPPLPRRGRLVNACAGPLTVSRLWLGEGTSAQFRLSQAPATPLQLGPGEGFELQVDYARDVMGQHYTPLFAQADGEAGPLLVPLLAETNLPGFNEERFAQGNPDQLDVLFVVSNSSTARTQQEKLRAAAASFVREARARGLDVQVGVTSTGLVPAGPACPGGALGGEAGRLFPVDGSRPRILSGAGPDAATLLEQAFGLGTCHTLVQGLEAMRAALSAPLATSADDPRTPQPGDGNLGLLRPSARLAVVLVADEDDHSGFDPETYVQFLQSLKGPGMGHRVSAWALVPQGGCVTAGPPGPRFRAVAERTGGLVGNVCQGSYAGMLSAVLASASGLQEAFRLAQPPADPAAVRVSVDGRDMPAGTWRYDEVQQGVRFTGSNVPRVGSTVTVSYQAVCPPPP